LPFIRGVKSVPEELTTLHVEAIAEAAAESAVHKTLLTLGIDANAPLEFQKDMIHVRDWRMATDKVKQKGLIASIIFVILGGIAAILIAAGVKLPSLQ
jgi:hypothetical protein